MRRRVPRLLAVAFVCSLLVHLIGAAIVPGGRRAPQFPDEETVVSTAIRLEHRAVPRRHNVPRSVRTPVTPATAASTPRPALVPHPVRVPHLVRHVAYAHPRPAPHVTLPQVNFQQTIAALRAANNPLLSAARPESSPAAVQHHYVFDFSASVGAGPSTQGILTAVRSWHDGNFIYYYVRYWVQYADGSTETGVVPWPLRYPESAPNPFRYGGGVHTPLPLPLPDYHPPDGTVMHPLIAFCYAHRDELASCPIARGDPSGN